MVNSLNFAVTQVTDRIKDILIEKGTVRVAIDGRCGSGKSTFANLLSKEFDCNLFHMDDFFLTSEKRSVERLSEAGGNVDRERFIEDVLIPLDKGEKVCYKAYDCKTQTFKKPIDMIPKKVIITEGSYACHPALFDFYDLHIFLTVSPETQMQRITNRKGKDCAENFKSKWIPMEEKYFEAFDIEKKCELVFETD